MPFNGSGIWSWTYNWVNDAANGIPITASRMDGQFNDAGNNGFDNCLTRDGQGIATANLPMGGYKHTGVAAGTAATDYADVGSVQTAKYNWIATAGTADAITAAYSPAISALVDGQLCYFRATGANTVATPTFSPNGLTAHTITKLGGSALVAGDIPANLSECTVRYNLANTRWELLSPAKPYGSTTGTGNVVLSASPTFTGTITAAGIVMTSFSSISGGASASNTVQNFIGNTNSDNSNVLEISTGQFQKTGLFMVNTGANSGNTVSHIQFQYGAAVSAGSITSVGTTVTYGSASDSRLKDNVEDAPEAGDIIDRLRVRSFRWKADGQKVDFGLIAQEEFAVYPSAVVQGDDNPDKIIKHWERDDAKLVPLLLKEIQSLRARLVVAGIP